MSRLSSPSLIPSIVAVFAVCLFAGQPASAQDYVGPTRAAGIGIEVIRPSYVSYSSEHFSHEITGFASAVFITGYVPISPSIALTMELPFAANSERSRFQEYDWLTDTMQPIEDKESSAVFGNPFVGLRATSLRNPSVSMDIGLRIPKLSEPKPAITTGLLSDHVERLEAFAPDVLSITLIPQYRWRKNGLFAGVRGGPALWLMLEREFNDGAELFITYSAFGGYEGSRHEVSAAIRGRGIVTEDLDIGDRTMHALDLRGALRLGRVKPGLRIQIPLDEEVRDLMRFAMGGSMGISLN